MDGILRQLESGNRRSIGSANKIVAAVLEDPSLLSDLFHGMLGDDPIVRMRAADVAEKVTAEQSAYLQPFKTELIYQVARSEQKEVRWHVAQMLPRLELDANERQVVVEILLGYIDDESKIVKTFSMQALADLAQADQDLEPQVLPLLERLAETGSPAMRSRGKRLLGDLELSATTNRASEIRSR
jgi:hypothetical protein